MRKSLPGWAFAPLSATGVVLVVSMFLAWLDAGPLRVSGFSLASGDRWLWLVPCAGLGLAVTAASRSRHTRLAALAAGIVVAGDVTFEVARGLLHMRADGWLVLGGAALLLMAASPERQWLRVVGGLAVLAGFFAPWSALPAYRDAMSGSPLLWAIAVAGAAGVASGFMAHAKSGLLALVSGAAVYAVLLLALGEAAYAIFGLGAWSAFGASAFALVIALVAPGARDASPRALVGRAA